MSRLFLFFAVLLAVSDIVVAQQCQEDDTKECGFSNEGVCKKGIQTCIGGEWSPCFGSVLPNDEICDDGIDNDCDGAVDEGCACELGDERICVPGDYEYDEVGVCNYGVELCTFGGDWSGDCLNATVPGAELCGPQGFGNQLDDDCDGAVDEDCVELPGGVSLECTNRIKDAGEEGVDCGGPCEACNDCANGILELDEEKTNVDIGEGLNSDCGGLNCPDCPTCYDRVQNQAEESVDCGGPCVELCVDPMAADDDKDGLTLALEIKKGTDPNLADTDFDGVIDSQDSLPLCPNAVCDASKGETEKNCPKDCREAAFGGLVIVFIFVILFVAVGLYFYFRFKSFTSGGSAKPAVSGKKKGRTKPKYEESALRGPAYARKASRRWAKRKDVESEAEKKLRRSIEKIKRK